MKYFHPLRPITKTVPGELWSDPNYVAEEKIRGVQTIIKIDKKGRARFFSRHGKEQTARLQKSLLRFPKKFRDSALVGELYHPGPKFREYGDESFLVGLLNAKPEKARKLRRDYGPVQLKLFDIYRYQGQDLIKEETPYIYRKGLLEGTKVPLVQTTQRRKRKFFEEITAKGAEGVVLKDLRAPYNKNIFKIKPRQKYIYEALEIVPSETHPWAASIVYGTNNRPVGKVNIADPVKRRLYLKRPELIIGKKLVIEAEGIGPRGALLKPILLEVR
jgi:ATP-dependent DNA ligase